MPPISQLPVNASSARISTLGPVRRVTAFFAFLGLFVTSLTITSCSSKDSHESLMTEQANLYYEMAATLTELSEGSDPKAAQKKLTEQVAAFSNLRAKTAALPHPTEEESLRLSQLLGQQEARTAFFTAEGALKNSKHNSPQIFDILSKLHEAVPVTGEGNP